MAPVVRLPRPLTVAHREEQTGSIEAADGVIEPDRHDQAEHCLQQISVHDRNAGVKRAGAGAAVRFLLGIAQCERGKAETETAKVSVRNARRDAIDGLKKAIKKGMPEDVEKDAETSAQKLHDRFLKQIDTVFAAKEKEILTV